MQNYLKMLIVLCAGVLLLVGGVVSAQEADATEAVTSPEQSVDGVTVEEVIEAAGEDSAETTIIIQRGQSDQLDAVVEVEPAEPTAVIEAEGQPEEGVIDVAETLENEPEEGAALGIGTLVLLIGLGAIIVVGGAVLMRERFQNSAAA